MQSIRTQSQFSVRTQTLLESPAENTTHFGLPIARVLEVTESPLRKPSNKPRIAWTTRSGKHEYRPLSQTPFDIYYLWSLHISTKAQLLAPPEVGGVIFLQCFLCTFCEVSSHQILIRCDLPSFVYTNGRLGDLSPKNPKHMLGR